MLSRSNSGAVSRSNSFVSMASLEDSDMRRKATMRARELSISANNTDDEADNEGVGGSRQGKKRKGRRPSILAGRVARMNKRESRLIKEGIDPMTDAKIARASVRIAQEEMDDFGEVTVNGKRVSSHSFYSQHDSDVTNNSPTRNSMVARKSSGGARMSMRGSQHAGHVRSSTHSVMTLTIQESQILEEDEEEEEEQQEIEVNLDEEVSGEVLETVSEEEDLLPSSSEEDFGEDDSEEEEDPWAEECQERYLEWRQALVRRVPVEFKKLCRIVLNLKKVLAKFYVAAGERSENRRLALAKKGHERTIKERLLVEEVLMRVKYFTELTTEQVTALTKSVYHRKLARDEVLFAEGDPASAYYIVIYGQFQIMRKNAESVNNTNVLVAEFFSGESFGESTLSMGPKTRQTTTAIAKTEAEIFYVTRSGYVSVIERMQMNRMKDVLDALKRVPAFRQLEHTEKGREVLKAAAGSMVERTVTKGTVVIKQGEESDTCFFYLVKSGQLRVIRMVDIDTSLDPETGKVKHMVDEGPPEVMKYSSFPNTTSIESKVNMKLAEQKAQRLAFSQHDEMMLSPGAKPPAIPEEKPMKEIKKPVRKSRRKTERKEEMTDWQKSRKKYHLLDSVAQCKVNGVSKVPLEIDALSRGGCMAINTWMRKFNQPSVVSLLASSESSLYMLNKYDFQRAMSLSTGEDLLLQIDSYTDDERLLYELKEGEHWEQFKKETVQKLVTVKNLGCTSAVKRSVTPRITDGDSAIVALWDPSEVQNEKEANKEEQPPAQDQELGREESSKAAAAPASAAPAVNSPKGPPGKMASAFRKVMLLNSVSRKAAPESQAKDPSIHTSCHLEIPEPLLPPRPRPVIPVENIRYNNGRLSRNRVGPLAHPEIQNRLVQAHQMAVHAPILAPSYPGRGSPYDAQGVHASPLPTFSPYSAASSVRSLQATGGRQMISPLNQQDFHTPPPQSFSARLLAAGGSMSPSPAEPTSDPMMGYASGSPSPIPVLESKNYDPAAYFQTPRSASLNKGTHYRHYLRERDRGDGHWRDLPPASTLGASTSPSPPPAVLINVPDAVASAARNAAGFGLSVPVALHPGHAPGSQSARLQLISTDMAESIAGSGGGRRGAGALSKSYAYEGQTWQGAATNISQYEKDASNFSKERQSSGRHRVGGRIGSGRFRQRGFVSGALGASGSRVSSGRREGVTAAPSWQQQRGVSKDGDDGGTPKTAPNQDVEESAEVDRAVQQYYEAPLLKRSEQEISSSLSQRSKQSDPYLQALRQEPPLTHRSGAPSGSQSHEPLPSSRVSPSPRSQQTITNFVDSRHTPRSSRPRGDTSARSLSTTPGDRPLLVPKINSQSGRNSAMDIRKKDTTSLSHSPTPLSKTGPLPSMVGRLSKTAIRLEFESGTRSPSFDFKSNGSPSPDFKVNSMKEMNLLAPLNPPGPRSPALRAVNQKRGMAALLNSKEQSKPLLHVTTPMLMTNSSISPVGRYS